MEPAEWRRVLFADELDLILSPHCLCRMQKPCGAPVRVKPRRVHRHPHSRIRTSYLNPGCC